MLPDGAVDPVGSGRPAVGRAGQPQFANEPLANWRALLLRVFGGSRDSPVWRRGCARSNRATACCTIGGRQRWTPSGHLPRARFNELHVNLPELSIRLKQLFYFSGCRNQPPAPLSGHYLLPIMVVVDGRVVGVENGNQADLGNRRKGFGQPDRRQRRPAGRRA